MGIYLFFHSFHSKKKDRKSRFLVKVSKNISLFFYDGLESRSIHKQQFFRNTNMVIAFIKENANINQLRIVQIINSFGAIFITSQFSDPWQILSQFEFLIPCRWFKLKKVMSSPWNNIRVGPSKIKPPINKYINILFRIIKIIFFLLLISWTIPTRGPNVTKTAISKHLKPWKIKKSKLWVMTYTKLVARRLKRCPMMTPNSKRIALKYRTQHIMGSWSTFLVGG